MKRRAIFIGPQSRTGLSYGMTGTVRQSFGALYWFTPDGGRKSFPVILDRLHFPEL